MSEIRRRRPRPCGSRPKATRRCHCLPRPFRLAVSEDLAGIDETVRLALYEELAYLPRALRIHVHLFAITPVMERAIQAIHDQDIPLLADLLDAVVAEVDSPGRRIRLARDVFGQRDQGHIRPELAAAAILELDRMDSILFRSAVYSLLEGVSSDRGASPPNVNPTP